MFFNITEVFVGTAGLDFSPFAASARRRLGRRGKAEVGPWGPRRRDSPRPETPRQTSRSQRSSDTSHSEQAPSRGPPAVAGDLSASHSAGTLPS